MTKHLQHILLVLFVFAISNNVIVGQNIKTIVTGQDSAAIILTYTVSDASDIIVTTNGNTVIISDGSGGSTSVEIDDAASGTTIVDDQGNLFAVDADGNVTSIGTSGGDGTSAGDYTNTASEYNQLDSNISVTFSNNGRWAFDMRNPDYKGSLFDGEYEKIGDYYVPWKFIPIGKSDKIKARLTAGEIDDHKKLKFLTPTDTEFFAEYKNGEYLIELTGAKERDGIELYAIYQPNDTTKISLGKIKIASYPKLSMKVKLIPMGKFRIDGIVSEDLLNEIYAPYYIDWKIGIEKKITDNSWDTDGNGLQSTGSEFYSMFTPEMRALNKTYKEIAGIDEESLYLFIFPDGNTDPNKKLLGDMPLKSRFGYIFGADGAETDIITRTVAHELGHGAFQLKHTFSEKYGIDKNTTDNLMDYDGGTKLVKYQWDVVHDPQNKLFNWSQDEEEGRQTEDIKYSDKEYISKVFQLIRCASINQQEEVSDFQKQGSFGAEFDKYGKITLIVNNQAAKIGKVDFTKTEETYCTIYSLNYTGLIIKLHKCDARSVEEDIIKLQNYLFPDNVSAINNEYNDVLQQLIGKEEFSSDDIEQIRDIANCAGKYFSVENRFIIIKKIFSKSHSESSEDLILDLIENFNGELKTFANEFLTMLNNDPTFTKILFKGVDNSSALWGKEDNFDRFLQIIYSLWLNSDFTNFHNYTYTSSYLPGGTTSPRAFTYDASYWFPKIKYVTSWDKNSIVFHSEYIAPDGNTKRGKIEYSFFQPVTVISDKNTSIVNTSKKIPAIILSGIVDKNNLEHTITSLKLTADIVLTLTGVGNLTKLRHLTKLQKGTAIVLAGIEISSSALDIMLNYTEICSDDEFCTKLNQYNAYLQIALLGGEAISSIAKTKIRTLKKELSNEYPDSRNKIKEDLDDSEIKQLDEHFGYKKESLKAEDIVIPSNLTYSETVDFIRIKTIDAPNELVFVLDDDGKVLYRSTGGESGAEIDIQVQGLHIVHNHPAGSVLSVFEDDGVSDLKTLIYDKPKSLTSFGSYGDATIYESGTTIKMYEDFIKNDYRKFNSQAINETKHIENTELFTAEYSKVFLKLTCDKLNIKYIIKNGK